MATAARRIVGEAAGRAAWQQAVPQARVLAALGAQVPVVRQAVLPEPEPVALRAAGPLAAAAPGPIPVLA